MRTLLLPGLDGTGRLFGGFVRELPPSLEPEVVSYPRDVALGYEALLSRLPLRGDPVWLVAESFSGPLAILAAAAHPEVSALVLVASFATCPARWPARPLGALLPSTLFRRSLPPFFIRRYLLGDDAAPGEVAELQRVVGEVAPAVLAARFKAICAIDVAGAFAALRVPVMYLAGSRDRLVSARVARRLLRLRPATKVKTLDAPHLVLQRRPAEAAVLISTFFKNACPLAR
jgi:pimeloyl-[acyl-carrier protein] methyl ester esterase